MKSILFRLAALVLPLLVLTGASVSIQSTSASILAPGATGADLTCTGAIQGGSVGADSAADGVVWLRHTANNGFFSSLSKSAETFQVNGGSSWTGKSGILSVASQLNFGDAVDGSGTTGNQTINAHEFRAAFAGSTSTITITNSAVAATSVVLCSIQTNDATALLKNVVPAAGSVAITLNANTTGTTKVGCVVFN